LAFAFFSANGFVCIQSLGQWAIFIAKRTFAAGKKAFRFNGPIFCNQFRALNPESINQAIEVRRRRIGFRQKGSSIEITAYDRFGRQVDSALEQLMHVGKTRQAERGDRKTSNLDFAIHFNKGSLRRKIFQFIGPPLYELSAFSYCIKDKAQEIF
jgi:hypothetical protein